MKRIRTKICGVRTLEEARSAIESGADALGFVFYPKSKRFVSVEEARRIVDALPPFVSCVGLVVNPSYDEVISVLSSGVHLLQFHGDEPESFCCQFDRPYIKALGVDPSTDIETSVSSYSSASALLLDVKDPVNYGGTGTAFNWQKLAGISLDRVIVAGGLNVENLPQLLQRYRPFAVDVSSGVEYTQGGKCPIKMREFCALVTSS